MSCSYQPRGSFAAMNNSGTRNARELLNLLNVNLRKFFFEVRGRVEKTCSTPLGVSMI